MNCKCPSYWTKVMCLQGGLHVHSLDGLLPPFFDFTSRPSCCLSGQQFTPISGNTDRGCFPVSFWTPVCRFITETLWNLEEKMVYLRRILFILSCSEDRGEGDGNFSALKPTFYLITWVSLYNICSWEKHYSKISEWKDMGSSAKTKPPLQTSLRFISS